MPIYWKPTHTGRSSTEAYLKKYPHWSEKPFLERSLEGKRKSIKNFLSGNANMNHIAEGKEIQVGVLDYLTLGIPLMTYILAANLSGAHYKYSEATGRSKKRKKFIASALGYFSITVPLSAILCIPKMPIQGFAYLAAHCIAPVIHGFTEKFKTPVASNKNKKTSSQEENLEVENQPLSFQTGTQLHYYHGSSERTDTLKNNLSQNENGTPSEYIAFSRI